ncbi:hypothetical protein JZ751_029922 [Albula glossodonta]|uniref:Uncharacterized protein n=1 Tax=Albula glossodonta TaxID=121402 RepID=A0A8T2N9I1_9TELE|nr:hypothetical protein JZ751_029922 [Albula glossodonta]
MGFSEGRERDVTPEPEMTPPVPPNGAVEGRDLHFGGRITFRCNPGFALQGHRSATCRLDGVWSAPFPLCVPRERTCGIPKKPTHGDHLLLYGPGDVLIAVQYQCNRPYMLVGTSQRTCLTNSTWSGTAPSCVKPLEPDTRHEKEKPPDKDKDTEDKLNTVESKDKGKTKSKDTGRGVETVGSKDTGRTTEKAERTDTGQEPDRSQDTEKGEESETDNQSISVSERTRCPPPPKLYNGYHQLVQGSGGDPDRAEFFCNNSYALSGGAVRTCQLNGSWSGKPPLCVRACREPKVSELVKQQVLPPQVPPRKTPLDKLYSSTSAGKLFNLVPTKVPLTLPPLAPGFHHLYTYIEYECTSPFYHHSGSPRRTCLKTGKWSGRHPEKLAETRWPWHAAIYRRSGVGPEAKPDKKEALAGGFGKAKAKALGGGDEGEESAEEGVATWQLVCSGALVNQRSVVVAAHCVTELGKLLPIDAAKIKVVMGKHYRSDLRETKNLQHLRVSSVLVHPNYDPLVLDSDIAVLKLLDKARISERVLPVCLPAKQGGEVTARQAYVVGWSILPGSQGEEDEMARAGLVELGDVVQCERQYAQEGAPVSITDNMLCGRQHPRGLSNICPADTGGIVVLPPSLPPSSSSSAPLFLEGQETTGSNVWRLLGVVSHGFDQQNCRPDLYTVYTRTGNFKDWIEASMK